MAASNNDLDAAFARLKELKDESDKNKAGPYDGCLLVVFMVLLMPFTMCTWAWVGTYQWAWFVPVFWASAPLLGFKAMLALRLMIGFMTYRATDLDKSTKKLGAGIAWSLSVGIFMPLVLLAFGWLIHFFVHVNA